MNRIDQKFKDLKKAKKKAFIAFITAGDPNLKVTKKLVLVLEQSGVDIMELGVPFSDPMADGKTIQASSQRALDGGVTLEKILRLVKEIRKSSEIPIALMTYYNPVFHMGERKFLSKAKAAGVDGLIIPDLPPEEATSLIRDSKKSNISTVFFLAPTSSLKRMNIIAKASSGFIYFVSLTGVTGARKQVSPQFKKKLQMARKLTQKPICVGFGVSTREQVQSIAKISDGVIVGSAIINVINKNKSNKNLIKVVSAFVRNLSRGI